LATGSAERTVPDAARPRIVVADDHPELLASISALLSRSFEIVASAGNGEGALRAARSLKPDVVVLDVTMPVMDGLRAATEMRNGGSRTPVVFLSMHTGQEYVAAAIAAGAAGYVTKMRIDADLIPAVKHALAGRMFAPTPSSFPMFKRPPAHAIRLRHGDDPSEDDLGRLIDGALRRGEPVCVVATPALRSALSTFLTNEGHDLVQATAAQRYSEWDAQESIDEIWRHGRLNPERVAQMIHALDASRRTVGNGTLPLTVVGDLSGLLCRRGDVKRALEMERAWNETTRSLPFLTICSYQHESVTESADTFDAVCHAHDVICHG
jgi:DNA-binding NarL/FixJ family response regulator